MTQTNETLTNESLKNESYHKKDEAMKELKKINQKLDYIIKLLREEEYKYPFHSNYIDNYNYKK